MFLPELPLPCNKKQKNEYSTTKNEQIQQKKAQIQQRWNGILDLIKQKRFSTAEKEIEGWKTENSRLNLPELKKYLQQKKTEFTPKELDNYMADQAKWKEKIRKFRQDPQWVKEHNERFGSISKTLL